MLDVRNIGFDRSRSGFCLTRSNRARERTLRQRDESLQTFMGQDLITEMDPGRGAEQSGPVVSRVNAAKNRFSSNKSGKQESDLWSEAPGVSRFMMVDSEGKLSHGTGPIKVGDSIVRPNELGVYTLVDGNALKDQLEPVLKREQEVSELLQILVLAGDHVARMIFRRDVYVGVANAGALPSDLEQLVPGSLEFNRKLAVLRRAVAASHVHISGDVMSFLRRRFTGSVTQTSSAPFSGAAGATGLLAGPVNAIETGASVLADAVLPFFGVDPQTQGLAGATQLAGASA